MNRMMYLPLTALLSATFSLMIAQPPAELQKKIADLKQSMATNQAALRKYSWTETVELSIKGEQKSRDQSECRYGADGKVIKTPVGEKPDKDSSKKKIGGKIVAKKVGEFKEYMERVGSLIKRYVPPSGQQLAAAHQAGNASIQMNTASTGTTVLLFKNYVKQGDEVAITLNNADGQLASYTVKTYLDSPEDVATLAVKFQTLADKTRYVSETLLDAKAKQAVVKTTNFGYQKVAN